MTKNENKSPQAAGNISSERMDLLLIANLITQGAKVLDIGCGEGELLSLLKTQKQIDGRGLEISQKNVNICVARGLVVVQGDAMTDLIHYPNAAFDCAILSQTLQAMQKPDEVLRELARISKRLIVSIPNFGHWRVRYSLLLSGRMPYTKTLAASWYETPNIHLCTLLDFNDLCATLGLVIERCILLRGKKVQHLNRAPSAWENWRTEQAIFILSAQN